MGISAVCSGVSAIVSTAILFDLRSKKLIRFAVKTENPHQFMRTVVLTTNLFYYSR